MLLSYLKAKFKHEGLGSNEDRIQNILKNKNLYWLPVAQIPNYYLPIATPRSMSGCGVVPNSSMSRTRKSVQVSTGRHQLIYRPRLKKNWDPKPF